MFSVVKKRHMNAEEKLDEIQKLLHEEPQPDINARDANNKCNTALHLAVKENELDLVYFLLCQRADTTIKNGKGKTPLDLAKKLKYKEIINVLQSSIPQLEMSSSESNSSTKIFLSRILTIDDNLDWRCKHFKQSIEEFYANKQTNKQITAIDQLKATPPYPTPHVLAHFASMAYCDCKHGDPKPPEGCKHGDPKPPEGCKHGDPKPPEGCKHRDPKPPEGCKHGDPKPPEGCKHGDPEPPEGWQLLTTAYNSETNNGYFGTAYWHPEHQQVVIAHRGTKNFGSVVTDVKGVVFNKYVPQMSSARTFANEVVAVLQEIEQEQNVSFEIFFTGHSLGGWLAQITTFTTEHLEKNRGTILGGEQFQTPASSTVQNSHDIQQIYHPHTVVFESPGCKYMLIKMKESLYQSLPEDSILLKNLDITSYVSAPNRINTFNSHLGTVYRILTDLSDMGSFPWVKEWLLKYTVYYTAKSHKIKRIVQALKGETKMREVVDWPVGYKEYIGFFEWGNRKNHYDPVVPESSQRTRYQTKDYDKCAKSLSVFTQDQREFLVHYYLFPTVPELFEIFEFGNFFSELNDDEAENKAQATLQNFAIDKGRIRCENLHELIPYVRRLDRLFPDVTKNLLSLEIIKKVYQYETKHFVEKMAQSTLDYETSALNLTKFIESDKQIWQLQMTDVDAWTGITKVYRVLQKTTCTPNYYSDGLYTILKLNWLILTVNLVVNKNAILTSMKEPHLLMIACGKNLADNDELRDLFKKLFSILKQSKTLKIILTAQSEGDMAAFIEDMATETLGEGFIKTDEQLAWSDFTFSSQTAILEKTVVFQGRRVVLDQLISAESVADSFPIVDLLQEKELRIGEEPVPCAVRGYNEKYYIDRTFSHNNVIRQDILSDKSAGKFADLLAMKEQKFKQFCEQNKEGNVHCLLKDKPGSLVWQQSQGDLKTLRKYIDAQKSHSYAPSDLDNLLQQANHKRVMIIADKAGMGKTTVLTHLSERIKQKNPALWFVRIDLNDYKELLEAQKGKDMDEGWVLEFVSKEVLKLESHLEKELFKKSFKGNEIKKVVVMVEGFDKISPIYKETVLDMLQVLKQISLEQLWVTTRPHLREDLEDNLQQLSYTLQPLSEVEQVEFLKKFWYENLDVEDKDQDRLQIYAEALIRKLSQSIGDKDKEFTAIPLHTRMLAEAFEQDCRSFYLSDKSEPALPHKMDLLGLYRRFFESKHDIYCREQFKTAAGSMYANEVLHRDLKYLQMEHQRLAIQALFSEDQVKFLEIDDDCMFSDEELVRFGIMQRNSEGKLQFIHRSFAEYFVAEFLIQQLTKEPEPHPQVQEFLVSEVLLRTDSHVIRAFLDELFATLSHEMRP